MNLSDNINDNKNNVTYYESIWKGKSVKIKVTCYMTKASAYAGHEKRERYEKILVGWHNINS
jgi:hypothetical protein